MLRPLPLRFSLVLLALFSVVLVARQMLSQPANQLRIVVPALPGDGALILLPDGRSVLIDGGGDGAAMATWLGNTLPFGQRRIDVMVLTRADAHTLPGQLAALKRYEVSMALAPPSERRNNSLDAWYGLLEQQRAAIHSITAKDRLTLGECHLQVLAEHDGRASVALQCAATIAYFFQSLDANSNAALEAQRLPPAQLIMYHWQRATKTPLLQQLQPQALVFSEGGDEELLSWNDRQVGSAKLFHEAIHGQIELTSNGRQHTLTVEHPH